MKAPSKNISKSLASQRAMGRGEEQIEVSGMATGGPSMVVPGDGRVSEAPGREHERSARKYTDPMRRYGGG